MPSTKQARREQAAIRQAKHDALSIDEKIKKVQARGGSAKELKRLMDKKEELNKKKG
jgi:hypothetical protein